MSELEAAQDKIISLKIRLGRCAGERGLAEVQRDNAQAKLARIEAELTTLRAQDARLRDDGIIDRVAMKRGLRLNFQEARRLGAEALRAEVLAEEPKAKVSELAPLLDKMDEEGGEGER